MPDIGYNEIVKDGIYQWRNSKDNQEKIQKEARDKRALKTNPAQLKLRERVQADEQTRVNKHGEGFCYGCAKTDLILSTLVHMCNNCMHKRGTEGLMAIVKRHFKQELCDSCGFYKFGVMQINASFCQTCIRRIGKMHQAYRASGGQLANHPYYKHLQHIHGKDWMLYLKPGRKLPI